jgi:hypothetical protein
MTIAKSKIIFIASGGHSGSTLLDLTLGSSPEVFSLGELMFFKEYNSLDSKPQYKTRERVCTCGQQFRQCDFWRRVTGNGQDDYKIIRHKSLVEDIKIAVNIFNPFKSFLKFNIEADETNEILDAVEREARKEKPGIKYLLDSSKDPRRLYRIGLRADREIVVIHLIRDVRGFAYSHAKKVVFGARNPYSSLVEWLVINWVVKKMVRNKLRTITVRYEDFCRDHKKYVQLFNEELGVNIPEELIENINSGVYHNINGNPLRFRKLESIKQDDRWQEHLPKPAKFLLAPFARLF